ncbi:MAG: serine hydrolase [Chitinophagaceae bacterium]
MRTTLILICSLITIHCKANAPDSIPWNLLVEQMQRFHNRENADSFITLLSPNFLKAVPPEKFRDTHKMLKDQLGEWKRSTKRSTTGKNGKYLVETSSMKLILDLYVDDSAKIEGYFFAPFNGEKKTTGINAANPMRTAFDSLADQQLRQYLSIPGTKGVSAALIDGAETRFYNYSDAEQPLPDSLTIYEIGSITKTFTANMLAQLVLQGKMKLNDPINKYLPDSVKPQVFKDTAITVVSLSNHTSGYPEIPPLQFAPGFNMQDPFAHYSKEMLMRFLNHFSPYRTAGAKFQYSNLAVGLLGNLIENVAGESYEELLQKMITGPLGMNYTTITIDAQTKLRLASGHNDAGNITPPWNLAAFKAAGAIRSNTVDLVKYTRAQWDEKAPGFAAIQLTHQQTNSDPAIGLGWFLLKKEGNDQLITHNGKTGGFGSYLIFNPVKKKALIFLFNSTAGSSQGKWMQPLIDTIR